MATLNDAYRKITEEIARRQIEFVSGAWTSDEATPEWHGMMARRQLAHIAGLQNALDLINQLQRDN